MINNEQTQSPYDHDPLDLLGNSADGRRNSFALKALDGKRITNGRELTDDNRPVPDAAPTSRRGYTLTA